MQATAARLREETGLPFEIVVSARSRRLSMRADSRTGKLRVSVPMGVPPAEAERFIRNNILWARTRAAFCTQRIRMVPGAEIPVMGVGRTVRQDPSSRFLARLGDGPDGPEILVGRTEAPEAHVLSALKREALLRMEPLTHRKAALIGRRVSAVTIKDTASRWGSCSSSGAIAYSWRIVLAPPEISDYLAAHEVAHRAEMNHSPAFWKVCASLSGIPPSRADAWIKANSSRLMRYGPP